MPEEKEGIVCISLAGEVILSRGREDFLYARTARFVIKGSVVWLQKGIGEGMRG